MFQLIRSYIEEDGKVYTHTEPYTDLAPALHAASVYVGDSTLCAISIIDRAHDIEVLGWVP